MLSAGSGHGGAQVGGFLRERVGSGVDCDIRSGQNLRGEFYTKFTDANQPQAIFSDQSPE